MMCFKSFRCRITKSVLWGALLCGMAFPVSATESNVEASQASPAIPWANNRTPCWDQAGAYHGVDPWLLYAIAHVESRHNPSAINRSNRNGTRDMGMMQINSVWLPELRRHGIPESALYNACASTYIGAWILAKNFDRYGQSWEAIAAYNVGSLNTDGRRTIGRRYAERVYRSYEELARTRNRQIPVVAPPVPGR